MALKQPVRKKSRKEYGLKTATMALATLAGVGVLAAIAVPNLRRDRCCSSPLMRCRANQKTLAGALEMYQLDKNQPSMKISPALFEVLKSEGYLQSVPEDPQSGPGSSWHYISTDLGNRVACLLHGAIAPPERNGGSAVADLESVGVEDPLLLAAAAALKWGLEEEDRPRGFKIWDTYGFRLWAVMALLDVFLLVCWIQGWHQIRFRSGASGITTAPRRGAWGGVLPDVEAVQGPSRKFRDCPACHEGHDSKGRGSLQCPRCDSVYHEHCVMLTGGCTVYGCLDSADQA